MHTKVIMTFISCENNWEFSEKRYTQELVDSNYYRTLNAISKVAQNHNNRVCTVTLTQVVVRRCRTHSPVRMVYTQLYNIHVCPRLSLTSTVMS